MVHTLSRRSFVSLAATAPLALSALGIPSGRVDAMQTNTRTPLIVLFLAGGPPPKEWTNPDEPTSPIELRGPFQSINTRSPGIHFSELWPKLALRSKKFSLLRGIDAGHTEHTEGMWNFALQNGEILPNVIGKKTTQNGIPYVLLNPQSRYGGLSAFKQDVPLMPIWEDKEKKFSGTQQSTESIVPLPQLQERKALLDALDTHAVSPEVESARKFYTTAYDLLQGGNDLFKALALNPRERTRYGDSFSGDMVLTGKQFVEQGAGAVVIFHDPSGPDNGQSWDFHKNLSEEMKCKAPEVDHAASVLIDEITEGRLNAMLLIMGEIARNPKMNTNAGRHHWQDGNQAILVGGKIRPDTVFGVTNNQGKIVEGKVQQKGELGNTIRVAIGEEIDPALPRVREILS